MNNKSHDAFAALRIKDYRSFIFARFFLTFAIQMQSVIVGWQVYKLTHDALSLGLIGLAEVVPFLCIAIFAGHVADVVNRKKIILVANSVYFVCAILLLLLSWKLSTFTKQFGPWPIYLVIVITGFARAFIWPAMNALIAQLVPRELYANSSTWNSAIWHVAAVSGPAFGGLIYGFFGIEWAYLTVVVFVLFSFISFVAVRDRPMPVKEKAESLMQSLKAGIRFVFNNQIVLSAVSLDMFAVFFGGAVAMLPIFAAEVLKTGPEGLGMLRAAPAIGAICMAFILAYRPPLKNAGKLLLMAVSVFGLCVITFALSKNFYLSLIILAISGMFDDISVIIRATIIQLYTPDEMRGRVSSVNSVFIGSSNELGSFESGVAAKLMGLIPSVIFGGGMTLLVVAVTTRIAPKLRKLNLLS